ncbi:hypothetical protein SAMN04488116_0881 [Flagellimonas flava]|uniref:Uncharacterized protein n=1 Tax=Flagellimonas flava TaxID=570519 RepID=A0A1M5ISY6_9FLAO|nr:hypothetical protein SAMN04488116_0881 [Allomuricauda flava]
MDLYNFGQTSRQGLGHEENAGRRGVNLWSTQRAIALGFVLGRETPK